MSCDQKDKNSIFIGGQVVKPSSSFVSLYYGNRILDTFLLQNNKRFSRKYDSLPPGIYKMEHIPEYTSLLLEPGDSMWVRINASDFHESLVFSGRGASKNNFLSDVRLRLDLENDFLASQYATDPSIFKQTVDSLLGEKKRSWIQMDSLNQLSPYARKITQAAYVYAYASIRERYALLRGSQWDSIQKKNFSSYRRFLNYGENDLAFFDPYITYLMNYLTREALRNNETLVSARENTDFNIRRLKVIHDKIEGSLVRNNLARAVAYEELLAFENHQYHDKFLEYYFDVNTSSSYLKEIVDLHADIKMMEKGNVLPELVLQDANLNLVSSASLKKDTPTVLYFWSQTQMNHFKESIEKVQLLQQKYPHYNFVGISIQPLNPIALEVYKMMDLEMKNQYGLVNFGAASKKWVITLLNKSIVLDRNGNIKNGFANLMASDFEKEL